jgi:pimeloyl-ACP methyl ester carboxylesterase
MEAYLEAAPHPENLQSFFDKCVERMRDSPDIPVDAIRGIHSPTLVIVGDADVMRPEHAVDLFRLLPHARLAVLPGTDHMALMTRKAWLAPMVEEFLNAAIPKMEKPEEVSA